MPAHARDIELAAFDAGYGSSALLLEASSRIGRRAYTQDLGGYPLDLGCEWLHSGARLVEEDGPAAGFAHVSAEVAGLFGSDVASAIRPLAATSLSRVASIGGPYSCALPGRSEARARLARPFEDRLFFAGGRRIPSTS